jgi:SAM-dependent methyltransferase
MQDFYQINFEAYHEKTFHIDPASFLEPLTTHLKPGARILDVGCGSGRDLYWLREQGFKVVGFERSKGLADLAKQHAKCRVIIGDFSSYDFSYLNSDAIVLVGALVHVQHEKLESVLKNITNGLGDNGKVLITLKQGQGTLTDSDGRIFYLWQDQELRDVFIRLGFTILDFSRQSSKVCASDVWLGYVLEKR